MEGRERARGDGPGELVAGRIALALAAVACLAGCHDGIVANGPATGPGGGTAGPVLKGVAPAAVRTRARPDPMLARRLSPENRPLLPFFAALDGIDNGTAASPVVLVQIGDSHTANDSFSAQMRRDLQARFGAAGHGLMPAGIPFKFYAPDSVAVTLSGDWDQMSWFNPPGPPPFGISGVRITGAAAGASMSLEVPEGDAVERALFEIVRAPGGGTLEIAGGGASVSLPTRGPADGGELYEVALPPGTRRLEATLKGDGPVSLLSWGYERRKPGIIYQNHGTIGATQAVLDHLDPTTLRREMAVLDPALILVAFGTNEGFQPAVDPAEYAEAFAEKIHTLRTAAPGAAILVIGPPDAARLTAEPVGVACTGAPPPAKGKPRKPVARWRTPPMLEVVRQAQREVAAREGLFFWDWYAAMGGQCSMVRYVSQNAAMPDHVHMRSAGYHQTADMLFQRLMAGYAEFETIRGRNRAPEGPRNVAS